MTNEQLVSEVWSYAHVLRDRGISSGDYAGRIIGLLFLKMNAERERASRAVQPQNTRRSSV